MQAALILLVFLSFFENGLTVIFDVKLRLISFLILLLLFAGQVWRRATSPPRTAMPAFEVLMICWMAYGAISALTDFRFGIDNGVAYALLYNFISEYGWVIAYFGGKFAFSQGMDGKRLAAWTLGFGFALTSFALFEKYFHDYFEAFLLLHSSNAFIQENFNSIFHRGYGYDENAYRCVSFVLEFIAFSYTACVLGLMFLVYLTERRKTRYALGLAASLSALFLTQALSSFFTFTIIAAFHLFIVKKIRWSYLAYGLIFLSVLSAVMMLGGAEGGFFGGMRDRLQGVFSGTDEGLLTHFQDFKFSVVNNFSLFGHGMGTADFLHSALGEKLRLLGYPTIEHEYFRVLFEFGGVGFILYAAGIATLLRFVRMRCLMETDPWRRGMFLVIAYWLMQNILVGFAHRSFPTFESSVFPALFTGFLIAGIYAPAPVKSGP